MLVPRRRRRFGARIDISWEMLIQWLYPGPGVWLTPVPPIPENVELYHIESHPARQMVTLYFKGTLLPGEENEIQFPEREPFRLFELGETQEPPGQSPPFPWISLDEMCDNEVYRAAHHPVTGPQPAELIRRVAPHLPVETKPELPLVALRRFVEDADG